jgi:hypothetical protein
MGNYRSFKDGPCYSGLSSSSDCVFLPHYHHVGIDGAHSGARHSATKVTTLHRFPALHSAILSLEAVRV